MQFTKPFSELSKKDANIAGGKGASLGEMSQSGIPVPEGFAVLSSTFDHFLKETDLVQEIDSIIHTVDHKAIHTVEAASEKIRGLIENEEVPEDIAKEITENFKKLGAEFVAVRSSATAEDGAEHAWAGQLDSFLNTNEDTLLDNVRKCWGSLFTPRAIFYRFEKELHGTDISVAVVVQKMIQSEVSGIAFSVHPITEDPNQLIIEAGFGLGEAIVSGSITPDSYVVEKNPIKIIDTNINTQTRGLFRNPTGGNEWIDISEPKASSQVLTEKQILGLADLIIKIENHYGFPCDIEWAYENRKFYIVQSRPITTLSGKVFVKNDPILLLGAWNVMPLEAWRWFDMVAINKLEKITGTKIRVFTYVKDELHYQYVFEKEVNELKIKLDSESDKKAYLNKIYNDYYNEVPVLEKYLSENEKKDFSKFTDKEIVYSIQKFADLWTAITTQIWYAVFLDMWYPMPDQHKDLKEIAAKARDHTGRLHEKSNITERKLYEEAAKRSGLKIEEANFLFPQELIDAVSNHTSYHDEIKRRCEFCVTTSIEGGYKIYSGEKAEKLFEQYKPPSIGTEATKDLRGMTACRGKVEGVVKIIRKDKEFDLFKNGEILVTLQTMVHYLPIMEKSAAILTEFGGLTSHAAIVSRELNKPCIVGIPNLLASLKDGDMVEVDADKGVVRII